MVCACVVSYQAELAEEERLQRVKNRSRVDKCKLYSLRAFITLLITGILAGAVMPYTQQWEFQQIL